MADGQSFVGTVKSFNPLKGWGFVECPEAGGDLLLLKTELSGFSVSKGDQVSFNVRNTPKGLQAASVTVMAGPDGTQTFLGTVKTYNAEKGFGFLTSDGSAQVFGKDVFVMRNQFQNGMAMQGAQVQFKAQMGERGPVAVGEVKVLSGNMPMMGGGMGGMPMMGGMQSGMMGGGMMSMGGRGMMGGGMMQMGGGMMPMGGAMMMKPPNPDTVYYGTVKQVNEEKGWGHLTCQALTKQLGKADVFIMKTSVDAVPGLTAGMPVSFTVTQGPKGPHGTNIKIVDAMASNQVFNGTVKTFNEGKGWGFIESAEAKDAFGTDVFLHKKALNGETVNEGDGVQFSVDTSGGRAAATNVTTMGGSYGRAVRPSFAPGASPY